MKRILIALSLLVLLNGCIGYFEEAEKTTTFNIKEETIETELYYEGILTEKGESIEDCKEELEKLFPSVEAGLKANINHPEEIEREKVKIKILFLNEIKDSFFCELEKEGETGKLKVNFKNSRETIKKLGELIPEEGFILRDVNKEYFLVKIRPELNDFFALKINREDLKLKIEGNVIEVQPERFVIKEGFMTFYDTSQLDVNFVEIEFEKIKPPEIPLFLVAASFVIIIAVIFIVIIWRNRKPEEYHPLTEEQIKEKMIKELINGLGTREITIIETEKTPFGYDTKVMIKTRKYHITFNKKMELKDYIKIEEEENE